MKDQGDIKNAGGPGFRHLACHRVEEIGGMIKAVIGRNGVIALAHLVKGGHHRRNFG